MATHGSSAGPLEEHPAARRLVDGEHRATAWVFALVAGLVVGTCYLELNHVEVGPMSGNAVASATRFSTETSATRWARVCAITAFVLGVAIGIVIVEECARRNVRRVLTFMVLVEAALIMAFVAWGVANARRGTLNPSSRWQLDAFVALPAVALGIQTAALRRISGQTVRTVYISGMLTRSAEEAVRYAYWRRDRKQQPEHPWRNEPSAARIALLAGIIAAYVIGALAAGWLNPRWHLWTLTLPIALLLIVAAFDTSLDLPRPAR